MCKCLKLAKNRFKCDCSQTCTASASCWGGYGLSKITDGLTKPNSEKLHLSQLNLT